MPSTKIRYSNGNDGCRRPDSICPIVAGDTPAAAATSRCVSPIRARAAFNKLPAHRSAYANVVGPGLTTGSIVRSTHLCYRF